jgi:DNA protecting protein DprA
MRETMMVPTNPTLERLSCLSLYDASVRFEDFSAPPLMKREGSGSWLELSAAPEIRERAAHALERCRELEATVIYPGHAWYPRAFLDLEEPPLFLSCFGAPVWQKSLCFSVVGSREPTRPALDWLEVNLQYAIKARRLTTVSGGARGIDQKAHSLSLRAGLPTVAFLPSGLGAPYPSEFAPWMRDIVEAGGAVISEFSPDEPMKRGHFERRNRMIAAMGLGLLVGEARRRSGTLITARHARDLSRTVCVVPSFPGDARSAGSLDLLVDGATPVRDGEDLITLIDLAAPVGFRPEVQSLEEQTIEERQMTLFGS